MEQQNNKILINNKFYKYLSKKHREEVVKGNMPIPEGYELKLTLRKIIIPKIRI